MATSIFNIEKVYTEDTLQFWLFPHENNLPIILPEKLEDVVADYLAYLSPYTQEYIWNNEPFSLSVKEGAISDGLSGPLEAHLSGTLCCGDYTEDEWFVVFLLIQLTEEYPGLVCRMVDSDGEFLLIEAADHLPEWVDPDSAHQRVYLRSGQLHLIPVASSPSTLNPLPCGVPTVMDAVSTVNNLPSTTLASSAIQEAITMKIEEYPGKISKDQHIAHAHVPVGVAALLREYPTLVAPAIRAFCRRDQKDNKALRVMRHFPPEMRVLTSVRFSKALYAQLTAHPYTADPRTGWGTQPKTEKALQAHLLGIKLACGFEILVCSAGGVTPTTPNGGLGSSSELDELCSNQKWIKYRDSLKTKGYFRGELEGSKLHKELESNARQYFVSNVVAGNAEDGDEIIIGSMVVKLLNKVNADYDFFKGREARLVPPDDESWLEISPKSLDHMLSNKFLTEGGKSAGEEKIMDSLNKFMGHVSDIDGAEIPPELQDTLRKSSTDRKTSMAAKPTKHSRSLSMSATSGDPTARKVSSARKPSFMSNAQYRKISSQSTTSNCSQMSSFSNKIDMNADAFTDAAKNFLEFSLPEDEYWHSDDEASSGMSSYGGDEEDKEIIEENSDGENVTRKTSNGSQDSGVTNGTEPELVECMEQIEKELAQTNIGELLNVNKEETKMRKTSRGRKSGKVRKSSKKIPLVSMDDEFDGDHIYKEKLSGGLDSINMHAVRNIVETYKEEGGLGGPATTILRSLTTNQP